MNRCPITDLSVLAGSQVQRLHTTKTELPSLESLRGLKLTHLTCQVVNITDLSLLSRMPLVELHAQWNPIPDTGVAGVKDLKELSTLELSQAKVTDIGLAHIQSIKQLIILDLNETGLTDAGAAHLAGLTRLKTLRLDSTKLIDAGLDHLRGLMDITRPESPARQTPAGAAEGRGGPHPLGGAPCTRLRASQPT
jgi:Leucine-rich repeat (LRR) protein